MHDTVPKVSPTLPPPPIEEPLEEKTVERVSLDALYLYVLPNLAQTLKGNKPTNTLKPPVSQSRAAGRSFGKGDLDQAIRSMRDGKRRARPDRRPLSKIFLDGSNRQSHVIDP
jgi:diaphanous 1